MAADAHKEAEKKMSLARERELAAFIMRDVELRRQKAEGETCQHCKSYLLDTLLLRNWPVAKFLL